jgi:uncharacterized protein YecE (DUF72 family)
MGTPGVHIGTSGWSFDHWKGPFYPKRLATSRLFNYYVEHFQSVEINNSFYNLPAVHTIEKWRDSTPDGFIYAIKASRFITHMKKLKDPETSIVNFFDRVEHLDDKLGPILFQLPPRWGFDAERLRGFLEALPSEHRYTFEFRDESWLNEHAFDILGEHNAALCISHFDTMLAPQLTTTDFVYIRLHGPEGPYRGRYDDKTLRDWARWIKRCAGEGKDAFCYFDNDDRGHAPNDALRLKKILGV